MSEELTIIIGGGAAGICAAISKARRGERVLLCEKSSRNGRKILATGNGRCNLANDLLTEEFYNPAARGLVRSVFERFGKEEILMFFRGLGLETCSQDGRIFPRTNQAASVLKVLELELARLSVPVEYEFDCSEVAFSGKNIIISGKNGKRFECQKVVIAGGGKTYPAFGSDGSTIELARQMGHRIVEPVPSAVPLVARDTLCQALQGQRISARAISIIDGKIVEEATGELLFTKYGLSGTCILDVSESISVAINRLHRKDVFVSVDMVPFLAKDALVTELQRRKQDGWANEDMLVGILPNKLCLALRNIFEGGNLHTAVETLKGRRFKIAGTRGWNEADFTSGGLDTREINELTLMSKLKPGVYFAGEVLDVNGKRGGYNLAWAWASGYLAGQTK